MVMMTTLSDTCIHVLFLLLSLFFIFLSTSLLIVTFFSIFASLLASQLESSSQFFLILGTGFHRYTVFDYR